MLLLQLKFCVPLPHVMEGPAASFSPSCCLMHNSKCLTSCSFTACFAGASLGVSCDYEQTSVHRNTCCFWGCSFSQSHQYTKGRYVIWWSWTVFHDSCNACGLLDVCFLIKENCVLFDQFHPKIICRDSLFQYKLFP